MIYIEHNGSRWTTRIASIIEDLLEYFGLDYKQSVNPEEQWVELIYSDGSKESSVGKFTEAPSSETLKFYLEMAGLLE